MEFIEAKKLVWGNLKSAIEKFDALKEEHDCNNIEEGWDINHFVQKELDDSKSLRMFLLAAADFYDETWKYVESPYYSPEQAEQMRTILIEFSESVIRMLAEMYATDQYDAIFNIDEFYHLVTSTVFVPCAILTKEKVSSETESIADFIGKSVFGEGGDREAVYENLTSYCRWAIESGIATRDQYLKILLEYFTESDWKASFVLAVNRLVSPCDMTDDADVDSRVKSVIRDYFSKLRDEWKRDIIEQCSYRDIREGRFREINPSEEDPCPKKVLEETIRQNVVYMIETMWLEAEDQEQAKRDRELLKFNCIDCAYVSAMIKADPSLKSIKFNESRGARAMSDTFNIAIFDIHVLTMKLKDEGLEIHVHGKRQGTERKRCCVERYTVPFRADDWKIDKLYETLTKQEITKKVIDYYADPDGSDFRYSLIYLENYRGISHMSVSFDHKFAIVRDDNNVNLTEEKTDNPIKNFYGKKIVSMTGFVGKNGAGKTSVVDFLRDSFMRICNDLYDEKLTAENGMITMKPGQAPKYRLREDTAGANGGQNDGTRFFVVFYFMEKYYYLTNMQVGSVVTDGEESEGKGVVGAEAVRIADGIPIAPYQIGEVLPLYRANRRIVYFSQFLAPEGVAEREYERYGESERKPGELAAIGSSLFELSRNGEQMPDREAEIIDLSEETLDAMRSEPPDSHVEQVNISLFMQLVFYYCEKDRFKDYFGGYLSAGDLEVSGRLSAGLVQSTAKIDELKDTALESILKDPMAYISPFSSGQYSKFVLLSRLFWCIRGWEAFPIKFSEKGFNEKNAFSNAPGWENIRNLVSRYLKKTDSAVLFFDEADVYYHPNWQRGFVQDIMTMVEQYSEIPLQIVFTTNAPLMLSDLQQRDIYLMKNQPTGNGSGKRECMNPSVPTFSQNIHTLMAKPFFLDRTIGVFADQRIEWLIGLMIDVSSIVSFLRDEQCSEKEKSEEKKKRAEEEKSRVRMILFEKHRDIYNKTMAIIEAVGTLDSGTDEDAVRKKKAEAERDYVAEEIRNKELADIGTDESSYGVVLEFLQNHIKLIGEDVLRNELFDMFNDFRARIERGVALEALIQQKEKELEELKKKQGDDSRSVEPKITE